MLSAAFAAAGCVSNNDNNKSLDFETLLVNFSVKTSGVELPAGTEFAIASSCTRGEQTEVPMGAKDAASKFVTVAAGASAVLVTAAEDDAVTALSGDHNFHFYAVSPYTPQVGKTVNMTLPAVQKYADGVDRYLTYTAHAAVTTVIPDIVLEASTPAAVLNLSIPLDIVEENVPATLKSIEIYPDDEALFDGALAGEGTIDVETGEFKLAETGKSKTLTLEFPEGGLKLEALKTQIPVAVLPFTVPEGGFGIRFTDVDGKTNETAFFAQETDAGKKIAAGSYTDVAITASADGVVPVVFPVQFPISKVDGKQNFTKDNQPRWLAEGYWSCAGQPQAFCEWHKVAEVEHPSGYMQKFEIVNSGNISAPGVKGVWTGDYYEFTIPVKKFAAGTKIEMKFPIYGRQEPVFWNIDYLDGEQWKTANLHTEVCYDGMTSRECTFSLVRGAKVITETLIFENEVKSGFLKIRIVCVDGSIQADSLAAVATREYPYSDKSGYAAPFYFWDKATASGGADTKATPEVTSVSFSLVN